jgi:hypothetical protein
MDMRISYTILWRKEGSKRYEGLTGLVEVGGRVWDLVLGAEVLVEQHVGEGGLEELNKGRDDAFPLNEIEDE